MDPVATTIVTKGILAVLLVVGGILALLGGLRLYRDGTGRGRDRIEIDVLGFKANAATIGSAVMITAVLWGWMGYLVSPSYSQTGDAVQVYSFETQGGEVTSRMLAAQLRKGHNAQMGTIASDPEAIKTLFRTAVANAEARDPRGVVVVDGVRASIDTESIKASQVANGVTLTADFNAGSQTASMVFVSQLDEHNTVRFVPNSTSEIRDSAMHDVVDKNKQP